MDTFAWDWRKEHAAQLVADGMLTLIAIAADVGVSVVTLRAWRKHPEFAARVEEHLEALRDEVRRQGIAVRELRLRALNDRWQRMQAVVEARAGDPQLAEAPGGKTGLIVRDVKAVGKGEPIDVHTVDVGLLREFREHEK